MNRTAKVLTAAAALVSLAAAGAIAATGEVYSVVERGRDLLPYPSSKVAKVRVADTVTVYVETERPPLADVLNGAVLLSAATLAFAARWVLPRLGGTTRVRWFFGLLAAGVGFLALDELFGLHETIGHNLRFLEHLPGVSRPDDVILTLYAIPAFAFVVAFRDLILESRPATVAIGATLVVYGIATAADYVRWTIEEESEVISGVLILAAVVLLARAAVERHAASALAEYPR